MYSVHIGEREPAGRPASRVEAGGGEVQSPVRTAPEEKRYSELHPMLEPKSLSTAAGRMVFPPLPAHLTIVAAFWESDGGG